MVKIIRLENTYIDEAEVVCDVFYVEYSDSKLISTGDFILDNVKLEMTSGYLENFFNKGIYEEYPDYDENALIRNVNRLIYRMSNSNPDYDRNTIFSDHANRFLREITRDIKLNTLLV